MYKVHILSSDWLRNDTFADDDAEKISDMGGLPFLANIAFFPEEEHVTALYSGYLEKYCYW